MKINDIVVWIKWETHSEMGHMSTDPIRETGKVIKISEEKILVELDNETRTWISKNDVKYSHEAYNEKR